MAACPRWLAASSTAPCHAGGGLVPSSSPRHLSVVRARTGNTGHSGGAFTTPMRHCHAPPCMVPQARPCFSIVESCMLPHGHFPLIRTGSRPHVDPVARGVGACRLPHRHSPTLWRQETPTAECQCPHAQIGRGASPDRSGTGSVNVLRLPPQQFSASTQQDGQCTTASVPRSASMGAWRSEGTQKTSSLAPQNMLFSATRAPWPTPVMAAPLNGSYLLHHAPTSQACSCFFSDIVISHILVLPITYFPGGPNPGFLLIVPYQKRWAHGEKGNANTLEVPFLEFTLCPLKRGRNSRNPKKKGQTLEKACLFPMQASRLTSLTHTYTYPPRT